MPQTTKLADYLFTRLRQLGVESIFGVPGDFNLQLLDFVEPAGLHWVGTCNELNGGYAADAYSRIKGISAMITTFGVGELSAINAIAGANAELAPLVHIVGTPGRQLQESRAQIHHTFNDGNFRRFAQMHALVTVAQASITDPRSAPVQIDNALQQCLIHHRPVYIEVPLDMVALEVDASRLQTKIEIPTSVDSQTKEKALSTVLEKIKSSRKPMILVDGEIRAHGNVSEVHDFIKTTNWPTFLASFGKGLIDETLANVHGVYHGVVAPEEKEFVDSCDLVVCFGPHFSTTNSFGGSAIPKADVTISLQATTVQVGNARFRDLPAKDFLSDLLQKLKGENLSQVRPYQPPQANGHLSVAYLPKDEQVKQDSMHNIMSGFLRSGDIVLAETGTAGYVARDFTLPPGTGYFAHTTWLSIGYMLPAALGAAVARREILRKANSDPDSSRTILLIGDGSLQMTVQEISTMIREKLNIIIFVVNNKGYLIERCIHGWKQGYNDIANWQYLEAPKFFGAQDGEYATWQVKTNGELAAAMDDPKLKDGRGLRMVELLFDPDDAPDGLWRMLETYVGKSRHDIMKGP
jgi:pyruvate decarboxylase